MAGGLLGKNDEGCYGKSQSEKVQPCQPFLQDGDGQEYRNERIHGSNRRK
jgi:hypothetical protein